MRDPHGNTITHSEIETLYLIEPVNGGCVHRFIFYPVPRYLRREGYRQTLAMVRALFGKRAGEAVFGYGYEVMVRTADEVGA